MTRIDEALARARSVRPEDLRPAVPDIIAEQEPAFPAENEQEPQAAAGAGIAASADSAVLEPVTDLRTLVNAEKLSPTSNDPRSVEQYRRLAARLYLMQVERRTSVVLVTSAMAGEGKTLTAANLALTLSESYRRKVLLVDADLRRPWMHQMFGVPNLSGLNEGLRAATERKVPLIDITENLTLLTAGRPDADPMSVLSSDRMRKVIEEAGTRFDWVVIDTPPVGLLTDARLLAALVDTVLLVVQAGKTPLAAIKAATDAIGRDRILGIVLNRAEESGSHAAYGYYSDASAGA
jgi:protein-tyrosine kinase